MFHKTPMHDERRTTSSRRTSHAIAIGGLLCVLALRFSTLGHAAPPLGPTNLSTEEKPGVTLYQADGLKGSIPLKKVWVTYPSGDDGYWDLQFASANMSTQVQFIAKFVLPENAVFKAFEVKLSNSNVPNSVQITTNSADKWDGKTMIDKVTLSPWTLSNVLTQCKQQLGNGDGTFKSSATFNLQSSVADKVKARGFYIYPGNNNVHSLSSLQVKPTTRVTAYIVESDRKGKSPDVSRTKIAQPSASRVVPRSVRSAIVRSPAASVQPTPKRKVPAQRNAKSLKQRRTP